MEYRLADAVLMHSQTDAKGRLMVLSADLGKGSLAVKSPSLLTFLRGLPPSFTKEEAGKVLIEKTGLGEEAVSPLWSLILEKGIIVPAAETVQAKRARRWHQNGWATASFYHETTRSYPFMDMGSLSQLAVDADMMSERAVGQPPPSPFLELPHTKRVNLVPVEQALEGLDSYQARRTPEGLSVLMGLPFGMRHQRDTVPGVPVIYKSIPSGGARHPTEVFLAVFEHPQLEPGLYHYNVQHHALDLLREGNHYAPLAAATSYLFKSLKPDPWGCLFLASHVERAMWRYRDPRSFRAVLVDIGHATMAFQDTAGVLGYRTICEGRFHDDELYGILSINKLTTPLYQAVAVFP